MFKKKMKYKRISFISDIKLVTSFQSNPNKKKKIKSRSIAHDYGDKSWKTKEERIMSVTTCI